MCCMITAATLLLFAGTIIEFKGPNWDQDPITKALPRGKKPSVSDPVKIVELSIVIMLSMSMLDTDKENCVLKNGNIATPIVSMG